MKRLGIFCFYDKDGIVDSYIEYLLNELMTVLDKLIIVANGQVSEDGMRFFSRYTNELIIRENKGFDAGAYTDVIVNVLGDSIRNWDELILCNDTFFGPFVPMKSIFRKMEKEQADFWGLNLVDGKMLCHIQSYFLVFGTKILQNGELAQYFRNNINPLTGEVLEVIGKFEQGLFLYLVGKQYFYGTYCNTELCCPSRSPDICLERYGLPVLKKKAFSEKRCLQSAVNAVRYVLQSTNYDIVHISRCVQRLYDLRFGQEILSEYIPSSLKKAIRIDFFQISRDELDARIDGRDFYIYGTGQIGCYLYYVHLYKNTGLRGFVVSDSEQIERPLVCGLPVFHYGEIEKCSLVVLAVGQQVTEFLKLNLDKKTEYIELWK